MTFRWKIEELKDRWVVYLNDKELPMPMGESAETLREALNMVLKDVEQELRNEIVKFQTTVN